METREGEESAVKERLTQIMGPQEGKESAVEERLTQTIETHNVNWVMLIKNCGL